jgi:hypothetical protein
MDQNVPLAVLSQSLMGLLKSLSRASQEAGKTFSSHIPFSSKFFPFFSLASHFSFFRLRQCSLPACQMRCVFISIFLPSTAPPPHPHSLNTPPHSMTLKGTQSISWAVWHFVTLLCSHMGLPISLKGVGMEKFMKVKERLVGWCVCSHVPNLAVSQRRFAF